MSDALTRTILILGAGIMQIPAIRLAKRKGWHVIVADANPHAPGIQLADRFENVDLRDRDGMVRMAKRCSENGGLDGVFTAGTDFSTTVAWVTEACGLPGIPYEVALSATDKVRMRKVFKKSAVPCPRFVGLGQRDDPVRALKQISLPVVVKPVDNMGARGVRRVDSESDLRQAFGEAVNASRVNRVILESYMEGPELSVDAIVYRGEVTLCGIADRHICFSPYFVEMGHTMPTDMDPRVVTEAVQVFRHGVAALGIKNGAAKGDIKITRDGPKIGEIAARLSGGYMSGWTFPYSSGVEVTDAALNIALGLPPDDLSPRLRCVSAERAFISIPGTVREIVGLDEAAHIRGVKDVFLLVKERDDVVFPTNNVEKCGNVISVAPSRSLAVLSAEEAIRRIFIRLTPSNSFTDEFLLGESGGAALSHISAFRLKKVQNREALRAMPYFRDRAGDMAILDLPDSDGEDAKDWHGMKLKQALKQVVTVTGVPLIKKERAELCTLGRIFWNAFLKGGSQGGVYIIDTIRERRNSELDVNASSVTEDCR